MSQVVATENNSVGESVLDYSRFEILSMEALRLIRARRRCNLNGKHCEAMQVEIGSLQELTSAAIDGRLSASRR